MSNKLRSFLIVVMSIVVVMAALPFNALQVYADETYTSLTVSSNNTEMGKVWIGNDENLATAEYQEGQELQVTAKPAAGYYFIRWVRNGNPDSGVSLSDSEATINCNNSVETIEAIFGTVCGFIAQVNDDTMGSVQISGDYANDQSYVGGEVTLEATANTHYKFSGWKTNTSDETYAGTDNPYTVEVSGDANYIACFEIENPCTITFEKNAPEGKNVSGDMPQQVVSKGVSASINTNKFACPGYCFMGWKAGNLETGTEYSDNAAITLDTDITLYAQWAEAYDITYYSNNASNQTVVDKYLKGNTEDYYLRTGDLFSFDGYTFTGWYSTSSNQDDLYGASIPAGQISSDIPVYAHWSRVITLHANNGTNEEMTQSVPVGTTITIPTITSTSFTAPEGKQFLGWATKSGDNIIEYTDGAGISVTGVNANDVKELYALWGGVPVAITFEKNDSACLNNATGSMDGITVGSGLKTVLPANGYSIEGYSFGGWEVDGNTDGVAITKDADGKYIIDIDDAVFTGSTITLKAKWIKNNYGISFIDWDGSVIVENAQVPYGSAPTCESPARGDTTEHSYSFAGWKNTASGEVFKDGLPVATCAVTYQATYTESNRLYSVDASVSPSEAGMVTVGGSKRYNETAALTVEPAVGYHVVGWTNNSADTGTAGTAYDFKVAGDHTVVVYLEKDPHTINVTTLGGGEVIYNGPENPVYGDTVKVVATPYEGYHFVNWIDQGDNEVSKDAAYEFTVTSDYSYKAVFEINRYDIRVTAGAHGSVSGSESGTYNHFDSCEVVATPDKGYHFVGWEENGTIVSENPVLSFSVTSGRSFEAVFEINMYTVTYKNDDGTILQEGEMSWGSTASYQHMANPTKKPTAQFTYTFAGWDNKDTLVTKDITYTATYTYTVNKYKITFANEDGTVLQTGEIEYGKFPVYEKDTPTKASTVQETFTFAGWDKEISKVTGETVYTATYTSKPITKDSINYKYFTVAFVTNGGSEIVSQLVAEGGVAFKPEEPLRERYTFGGWYIDAALTKPFSFATVITSDITLYAKWIKGSPDIEATYAVVGLGSTSFELGSGEDITVAVERSKDNDSIATHFKGVLIDGVEVDYYNYELAEDNSSVIIRADAFEGLEAGNHTITIVYDDGTAEVELVVTDANEPTAAVEKITETEAGDTEPVNFTAEKSSNWGLWIALGIVAVVVIAAIPIFIIKGRSLK